MRACDRFEREGLLRLEQGLPLDEHFSTCPDCRAARAAYQGLRAGLAETGAGYRPPPDWQARTWAAIARRRDRRRRYLWTLAPAGLGLAVLALVLIPSLPRAPLVPSLAVEIAPGAGPVRRGVDAAVGDRLRLRAETAGASHAELRVYRNDSELVLRCSGEPPCERQETVLRASFELTSLGAYQSLLLLSDAPLPAPGAGFDADTGAALAAGARLELGAAVRVR